MREQDRIIARANLETSIPKLERAGADTVIDNRDRSASGVIVSPAGRRGRRNHQRVPQAGGRQDRRLADGSHGHHLQHLVDAGGPGEHVLDEAFVAGNVDDAQAIFSEIQGGEADVDGDAAGLLLGQTVAIDPGPVVRFSYEGWSFEVVDMDGHRVDKVLMTALPEE